jgi:ketosteroid isomerase-like protein
MAEQNIEVVRSLYRRFNAGDWEGAAQLAAANVVWVPDSRVGEEPVRGRDRVIGFFRDRAEMFDEYTVQPERFEENEGQVVALIRVIGRGSASGARFDIRIGHVWVLRDGVIVRGEGYGDRDRALEAVGVRE